MIDRRKHTVTMLALAGTAGLFAGAAEAATRKASPGSDGTVIATSEANPNIVLAAPTRSSPSGRQVRLPSGTWIDCAGDCRDTLRAKTMDVWLEIEKRDNYRD